MNPYRILRTSTAVFAAVFGTLYAAIALLWTLEINLISGLVWSAAITLPPADLSWFILSLVLYIRAKKHGDDDLPDLKHRLKTAVVLLILLVVLIALLIVFFSYAISHM